MPRHFILSADPSRFDLATRMIPGLEEIWRLTGNFRPGDSQIRGGDIVFMMRTRGSEEDPPRLYGWGMVLSKAPVPAPEWRRSVREGLGDGKGPTPHATRIRFLGVCDNPVMQSELDADPVGKGIELRQGGSQRISDEEAAFLTGALRKKRVKIPGGSLDKLTIARSTLAEDSTIADVQRVASTLALLDIDTDAFFRKRTFDDSGPPPLVGSEDILRALLQSDRGNAVLSNLLPSDSFLYHYAAEFDESGDPNMWTHGVSAELAHFCRWVCEISRIALGLEYPHPVALIAAMLTKEPAAQGSCAYELLRRTIPDMADARQQWLRVTSDPKSAQALFHTPATNTRAKSKSQPRLNSQQKR